MNREEKIQFTYSCLKRPGKRMLLLFSVMLMLLSAGCRQTADMPPVIVSQADCLLSSQNNTFKLAGVSFKCHNTGDKQISRLEVSFLVFTDASGGNPLYDSNVVTAAVDASLAPGESGTFEISLDGRLACIPAEPFFIDGFYVRKVVFADGSDWSDPYGMYYAGSLI